VLGPAVGPGFTQPTPITLRAVRIGDAPHASEVLEVGNRGAAELHTELLPASAVNSRIEHPSVSRRSRAVDSGELSAGEAVASTSCGAFVQEGARPSS